jgi:hypothetical protein
MAIMGICSTSFAKLATWQISATLLTKLGDF